MTLIEDAVDEMIEALKVNRTWSNLGVRGVVNLRLDLALADRSILWGALKQHVELEMNELVVDGDIDSTDPFLRAFDGEKKLEKSLSDFRISSAILEQAGNDQETKYTLYFKVMAEFDGEKAPVREVAVSKETEAYRSQEFE